MVDAGQEMDLQGGLPIIGHRRRRVAPSGISGMSSSSAALESEAHRCRFARANSDELELGEITVGARHHFVDAGGGLERQACPRARPRTVDDHLRIRQELTAVPYGFCHDLPRRLFKQRSVVTAAQEGSKKDGFVPGKVTVWAEKSSARVREAARIPERRRGAAWVEAESAPTNSTLDALTGVGAKLSRSGGSRRRKRVEDVEVAQVPCAQIPAVLVRRLVAHSSAVEAE